MDKLLIKPIANFVGFIFIKIYSFISNYGLSLIVLSFIINLILLPLYVFAEKIENKEKEVQAQMKPKIDEFKSVYKGYELHLYISNVYRLNNYHPAYTLRGLVSLLIQIPFFMGAYQFLSHYHGFIKSSFLFINDLSLADNLLKINNSSLNVLPFVMTFINLWSGYIYSKGGNFSEKLTIIIIAAFFLVILYNSPASLLIYWTFNNIFSLIKNYYTYYKSKKELVHVY